VAAVRTWALLLAHCTRATARALTLELDGRISGNWYLRYLLQMQATDVPTPMHKSTHAESIHYIVAVAVIGQPHAIPIHHVQDSRLLRSPSIFSRLGCAAWPAHVPSVVAQFLWAASLPGP
jgi:hypothetical protein